jgi:hypothetical protein
MFSGRDGKAAPPAKLNSLWERRDYAFTFWDQLQMGGVTNVTIGVGRRAGHSGDETVWLT